MANRPQAEIDVEIDTRALLQALRRYLPHIVIGVGIVAVGTWVALSMMAPRYKSETTLIIQSGESSLTRTEEGGGGDASQLYDAEAITSQVQLIQSRDLARAVAAKLNLADKPEFTRPSLVARLLAKVGIKAKTQAVEERVLDTYYDKVSIFAVDKSRVIGIDFTSTDPVLAADAANAIAAEYLDRQRDAKRDTTSDAAAWLATQIADLRGRVQDAEKKVEDFRSGNDLFAVGTQGDSTLAQQQLADLSTELTRVRAQRADAETKAAQIRGALKRGGIPNITDVLNSQLIQGLIQQQVTLRSEQAQLGATLLPGHPRMRELSAQIAGLDKQVAAEAGKIVDSLEGEAKLAAAREDDINANLTKLKARTATANDAGVTLRALDREAAAQRDLLDSYLRRYREALTREQSDYTPVDARIISRAAVSTEPDFPKKVPMTIATTVAATIVAVALVLLRELASGRPMHRMLIGGAPPLVPATTSESEELADRRWDDDEGRVRRVMAKEPTLVPEMIDRVAERLKAIAGDIVAGNAKRVVVTMAAGSDAHGRPLGAVALARTLANSDRRVVLIDMRGDGADAASMGGGHDVPGLVDLIEGRSSFAQTIFRDRKSRVHFVPAGGAALDAAMATDERLETILSALTLTYDYVLIDCPDDLIASVAPGCGAAVVVSEFDANDPRSEDACGLAEAACHGRVHLLVVDPAGQDPAVPSEPQRASA